MNLIEYMILELAADWAPDQITADEIAVQLKRNNFRTSAQGVGGICRGLRRRGLLASRRDYGQRFRWYSLTPKGRAIVDA